MRNAASLSMIVLLAACINTKNSCSAFGENYHNPDFSLGKNNTGELAYNAVTPSFVGPAHRPDYPQYPLAAAESQASGSATLQFVVGPDGKASDVAVVSWEGSALFARTAIAFVTQADIRFEPTSGHPFIAGRPTRYHINFRLASH